MVDREKIRKATEHLREQKIPHLIMIDCGEETMLSCGLSPEDLASFLIALADSVPQLAEGIVVAADALEGDDDMVTPSFVN